MHNCSNNNLLPLFKIFYSSSRVKGSRSVMGSNYILKKRQSQHWTSVPVSNQSHLGFRCEGHRLSAELLTFDTRREPTREDGPLPTASPRPAGSRRLFGSGPASVGWWWRWWSWSSTGCPRTGGMPGPPLIQHLKDKKRKNLSWNSNRVSRSIQQSAEICELCPIKTNKGNIKFYSSHLGQLKSKKTDCFRLM